MTPPPLPAHRFPVPLAPAATAALVLIAARAFYWHLAEWLSVFLCGPLLALLSMATAAVLLWSLVAALRTTGSWSRFLPAILCTTPLPAPKTKPWPPGSLSSAARWGCIASICAGWATCSVG